MAKGRILNSNSSDVVKFFVCVLKAFACETW